MGFETKNGNKLWQYNFPDVYWWISDITFIPGTDLMAISTDHFVPKEQRRYLHLMDRSGNMHNNMFVEIKDDFKYQREGVSLKSTSEGKYLIGATRYHKHLIELVKSQ
jgi:hypothetical protein